MWHRAFAVVPISRVDRGIGVSGEAGIGGDESILRRAPLFHDVAAEVVDALLLAFMVGTYARNTQVFGEGDSGEELYVVLAGRVSLSATDGSLGLLAVLDPGDMFGELSVFDPGPRTATATALDDDTRLARVDRQRVLAWAAAHPEVGSRLLQVLARRLRRTNSALRDLVFVDVPGRVAGVLLDLAQRYGQRQDDTRIVVEHGLTQTQLAKLVGASRETVNKALSDFAARGWISPHPKGRVEIHNPSALARRARRAT
jgi:CRP/FNR family cyclic AMP-dependent transcriptional regulator